MAKIISFANQKGGVGKTTSAINVAASLGSLGKQVLLIDIDPQGNCSSRVGINKKLIKGSVYDVLINKASAKQMIIKTPYENLSVLPSTIDLAGAELELGDISHREAVLKNALSELTDDYDYIIIDLPPSLGLLTINALTASNSVIVPMQCEYFALEGLSQLVYTIKQVKEMYNPKLELEGVILTMFDGRLNLSLAVAAEIKKHFPGKTFRNAVPRNVRLSEAPSHGKPILYYDKYSRGGLAYLEISRELLERDSK